MNTYSVPDSVLGAAVDTAAAINETDDVPVLKGATL